jgi:hypothetical protein
MMKTVSEKQKDDGLPREMKREILAAQGITVIWRMMIAREDTGGETVTVRMTTTGLRRSIDDETMMMTVIVHGDIENTQNLLVALHDIHENTIDHLTVDAIGAHHVLQPLLLDLVHGHRNLQDAGGIESVRTAAAHAHGTIVYVVRRAPARRPKGGINLNKKHL